MSLDFDPQAFFKGLDLANKRIQERALQGMEAAIADLYEQSQKEAPKLTGELRDTAKKRVYVQGDKVIGEVIYSAIKTNKRGYSFDIAAKLHEYGGRFRDPTTPGTRPKFLSRPLKARSNLYIDVIATEMQKGMG